MRVYKLRIELWGGLRFEYPPIIHFLTSFFLSDYNTTGQGLFQFWPRKIEYMRLTRISSKYVRLGDNRTVISDITHENFTARIITIKCVIEQLCWRHCLNFRDNNTAEERLARYLIYEDSREVKLSEGRAANTKSSTYLMQVF